MTASATTAPPEAASAAPTLPRSRFEAQQLRLKLLNDGWRTLESATDPRNAKMTEAQVGREVTIAYFPEFKAYGLASTSALIRGGNHPAEGCTYSELYRVMQAMSGSAAWIPFAANQ